MDTASGELIVALEETSPTNPNASHVHMLRARLLLQ